MVGVHVWGMGRPGEVNERDLAQRRWNLMWGRGVGAQENIVWEVLMAARVTWDTMRLPLAMLIGQWLSAIIDTQLPVAAEHPVLSEIFGKSRMSYRWCQEIA